MHWAPGLGEGEPAGVSDPRVYMEVGPISWSLLGTTTLSRVILGRDAEVGGCWVALPKPPPTLV